MTTTTVAASLHLFPFSLEEEIAKCEIVSSTSLISSYVQLGLRDCLLTRIWESNVCCMYALLGHRVQIVLCSIRLLIYFRIFSLIFILLIYFSIFSLIFNRPDITTLVDWA